MKIAIHNSGTFAPRWISYCKTHGIDFKEVNAYDNNIIKQIEDCDIFMWHHYHASYKDKLFAKQLLYSLQISGKKVFPDFNTGWHFDDKVGEMYLLQAIGAPLVPSYVFYSRKEAIKWLNSTTFPKVFKLRGGAGASNVMLAHNKTEAIKLVNKAFQTGFSQYNPWNNVKERWRKFRLGKTDFKDVLKGVIRIFYKPEFANMYGKEKGYVYFQEFIPNNKFDIRVCVVGNKAFAIKRMVRKNDFRASGSGDIIYSASEIDERCIKIAFEINNKIHGQSMGFDFIFDHENNPLIVEIGYAYVASVYDACEGYWTNDMKWHEGKGFDFCGWMIENIIK